MNTQQPIKTPQERDDKDLLELVCQLHSRASRYLNKHMHDAYVEARQELENRLNLYADQQMGCVRWVKASQPPKKSGWYFVKIQKFNAGARLLYSIELGWMYDERRQILRDDFPTYWLDDSNPCTCQTLREAAGELLHLHLCEQEGLLSGKPTPAQWIEAVGKLSEALADAGEEKDNPLKEM